jgi:hypothetical protein
MVDHVEEKVAVVDCIPNEVVQSYSASFKLVLIDHLKKMNNSNAPRKFRVLEANDRRWRQQKD